ncbi:MAG: DUF2382 domain-containing protein [Chloroflexi bacterium]|nr:DUF2382 domain-containing protein [Chloroflexota bacterium]
MADSFNREPDVGNIPAHGATLHLREEELVAIKEMRHVGDVQIRTVVEDVPHELQVEAFHEEVEVKHVPINRVVAEREAPRHEGETLIVPVYEEEVVVTKRLVLREELQIRRIPTSESRVFEQTLKRERLDIQDVHQTGLVHERYPEGDQTVRTTTGTRAIGEAHEGFLENLKRRVLQP